jgi:hypothetical protein
MWKVALKLLAAVYNLQPVSAAVLLADYSAIAAS